MLEFVCPATQEIFDGGIALDEDTYESQRMKIVGVQCPHCKKTHRFMLGDVQYRPGLM